MDFGLCKDVMSVLMTIKWGLCGTSLVHMILKYNIDNDNKYYRSKENWALFEIFEKIVYDCSTHISISQWLPIKILIL